MHGVQVSGRELRHRGWPDSDLSGGLHVAVSQAARLLALALLQSYCPSHQCLVFVSTAMIHFCLFPSYWIAQR